jgi:DNA-binding beta-propeller fold protein YncE
MLRLCLGISAVAVAVTCTAILTRAQSGIFAPVAAPGKLDDGSTLLPNGWRVAPAGKQLAVRTLPLNVVTTPDGRYAIVSSNGLLRPALQVVEIASWTIKSTLELDNAWGGLAWNADGTKLYVAGAAQNNVQELTYADGTLTKARTFTLGGFGSDTFAGGVAISRDGRTLFVTRVFSMTLSAIDLTTGQVKKTIQLDAEPYAPIVSPDGALVYVSLWGGARVVAYTTDSLMPMVELQSGDHPNAMAFSTDGRRLFVAAANNASVWVYDTFSWEAIEQISMSLYPEAPHTSTPNALAVSSDGRQLLVANADINAVAVVNISNGGRSIVEGFIPTGQYPTGVTYSRDGKLMFILSGKGLTPAANPFQGGAEKRLVGLLTAVMVPDAGALAAYNRKVYELTPYTDATRLTNPSIPVGSPIPRVVGGSSPIKHVLYIIRENRTYDSVLGDLPQGNGDLSLNIFGKDVTPNAHALSTNFVTFDNFYVDADVSFDGHAFSTAAYATDVIQKLWQTYYANRGGVYMGEGGGFMRNPFGNVSAPERGYIWDFAARRNVSVRSYGEFVDNQSKNAAGDVVAVPSVPGLKGLVASSFAGFDLDITDQKRADTWLAEFRTYEQDGNLPQLSVIHLPNDHTKGTVPGAQTPRAMMADNDLAMGRIVEALSKSVYWKDSVVLVVEDDAQSGADHVDSHRSVLLAAGPFIKRNGVDHSFYTTSGVLRTIELILGLEPMSHYDAAATPLYNAFVGTPNLAGYAMTMPRIALDEKNLPSATGAAASLAMNFSAEDLTPEVELNEIIWQSVKGKDSHMPPPKWSVLIGGR